MSKQIYGNDVSFIACKSHEIDTIPVVDGQIITLMNDTGMYYDMGGYRHQVSGSEVVNDLPSKQYAKFNTLYIVLSEYSRNLYIWNGTSYISLIPEQTISEDASDDSLYMRIKNRWISDEYTFYFNAYYDSEDSVKIENLNNFLSKQNDDHPVKVIGELFLSKYSSLNISGNKNAVVDFSQFHIETESTEKDTQRITFSEFHTIKGLTNVSGVYIKDVSNIEYCRFDGPVSIYTENLSEMIIDSCTFRNVGHTGGIFASSTVKIYNCRFIADEFSICGFLNEDSSIYNSFFEGCVVVSNKNKEYSEDSMFGDADSLYASYDYSTAWYPSKYDENCFIHLDMMKNYNVISSLNITSIYSIYWIKWHTKYLSKCVLSLGSIIYVSNTFELGVAHIDDYSDERHIILEVNPNQFTQYDVLPKFNSWSEESNDSIFLNAIIRKISRGDESFEFESQIQPMVIYEMINLDNIHYSSLSKLLDESYISTMLDIYRIGRGYRRGMDDKFKNSNHCFISTSGIVTASSSGLESGVIEYIRVTPDGHISYTNDISNNDDVRFIISV